jgi:hypothetical protein
MEINIVTTQKVKLELPFDPVIPRQGIYAKEVKYLQQKDTCMSIFISALFTIDKICTQPRCPSGDKLTKKMWHIFNMKQYSVKKE